MKKLILSISISFLSMFTLAQADENSCNCANKLSACPQDDLMRGAETEVLKLGKKSDDLIHGKASDDLGYGKKENELNRGRDSQVLTQGKKTDRSEEHTSELQSR